MIDTKAFAAFEPQKPLGPFAFQRREPGDHDIVLQIAYCGICHSDLHQVRNEWKSSSYPMVPGHEIVGRVQRVGAKVARFKPGDVVGVGCLVGSCGSCPSCEGGLEQYCDRAIWTYNAIDKDGVTPTQGGYSDWLVCDESFALRITHEGPLDGVAPLLCAGITTYSPLRHFKIGKGHKLGVVGLGGLGHMAVKLGAAFGAEVTLLSSSPKKQEDAKRLGASDFILTSDSKVLTKALGRFDYIIDTVSAPHDLALYAALLRTNGVLVLLGVPDKPASLPAAALIMRRRSIAGSLIGGIAETQEMLDFCAERRIVADVETIAATSINEAYERMLKSDVRYRFVIDCATI